MPGKSKTLEKTAAEAAGKKAAERASFLKAAGTGAEEILPGAGKIVEGIAEFSPPGAIITAAVMAYDAESKQIQAEDKDLDKEGEDAYEIHERKNNATQEARDATAQHAAEFSAQLAHAGLDKDPLTTERNRTEELAHAQIEAGVARANPNSPQNIVTNQEKAGDIEAMKNELTVATAKFPAQKAKADATATAVEAKQAKFNRDEAEKNDLKELGYDHELTPVEMEQLANDHPGDEQVKLKSAKDNLERLKEEASVSHGPGGDMTLFTSPMDQPMDPDLAKEITAAEQDVKQAEGDVKNRQKRYNNLNNSEEKRSGDVEAAKAERDSQEAILLSYQTAIKTLPDAIAQAIKVEQVRLQSGQATQSAPANNGINPPQTGAVAQSEQAQLTSIASAVTAKTIALSQAITTLQTSLQGMDAFMTQVDRLTNVMSKISPDRITALKQRVTRLEKQVHASATNPQ